MALPGPLLQWPNAVAVDLTSDLVYWCDARLDIIQYANLDGSNVRTIRNDVLKHTFALSVYGDWLYASDWTTRSIFRLEIKNESVVSVSRLESIKFGRHFGVKVHSRKVQPIDDMNPCRYGHHSCEKFCFTVPDVTFGRVRAQCGCSDYERLRLISGTCVKLPPNELKCSPLEFTCHNKFCIPMDSLCDGKEDCSDGSDEREITCKARTCKAEEFKCDEGACISITKVCDGKADCQSVSDERQNCQARVQCLPTQFLCDDNSCLPRTKVCDGNRDCLDGTDERQNCQEKSCSTKEFRCDDGQCIPTQWVCDRDEDCVRGTDERGCPIPTTS